MLLFLWVMSVVSWSFSFILPDLFLKVHRLSFHPIPLDSCILAVFVTPLIAAMSLLFDKNKVLLVFFAIMFFVSLSHITQTLWGTFWEGKS